MFHASCCCHTPYLLSFSLQFQWQWSSFGSKRAIHHLFSMPHQHWVHCRANTKVGCFMLHCHMAEIYKADNPIKKNNTAFITHTFVYLDTLKYKTVIRLNLNNVLQKQTRKIMIHCLIRSIVLDFKVCSNAWCMVSILCENSGCVKY